MVRIGSVLFCVRSRYFASLVVLGFLCGVSVLMLTVCVFVWARLLITTNEALLISGKTREIIFRVEPGCFGLYSSL